MELYTLLPILLISNKKVNGYKVNYEEYLVELLNSSFDYFMKKTNSIKFTTIKEQSHGENDAKANDYEIDFKLLVPTELMFFKNQALPEVDYNHMNEGFISIKNNEKSLSKDLQIKANTAFIDFVLSISLSNKNELLKLKDGNTILSPSVKNMLVNKNILIFIPWILTSQVNCISLIKKLFNNLFSIRDDINKETYITFLQGDDFQILKYNNGNYVLVDKINKFLVPTFMELYNLTSFI